MKDSYIKNEIIDSFKQVGLVCKSLILVILLFSFAYIPIVLLHYIGIDYNSFSKLYKIIYMFICNLIFLSFIILLYRKTVINDFKDYFNKKFFSNFKLSTTYWLSGVGIMIVSNIIISFITKGGTSNNEEAVRMLIDTAPWFMLFDLALYAPLTEELIFRKSIRDFVNNKYFYIIFSGLLFGGLHVITSVDKLYELLYIIPYSAVGMAFAALYYKTKNIFSSITVHSIHNSLSLILYLISSLL